MPKKFTITFEDTPENRKLVEDYFYLEYYIKSFNFDWNTHYYKESVELILYNINNKQSEINKFINIILGYVNKIELQKVREIIKDVLNFDVVDDQDLIYILFRKTILKLYRSILKDKFAPKKKLFFWTEK